MTTPRSNRATVLTALSVGIALLLVPAAGAGAVVPDAPTATDSSLDTVDGNVAEPLSSPLYQTTQSEANQTGSSITGTVSDDAEVPARLGGVEVFLFSREKGVDGPYETFETKVESGGMGVYEFENVSTGREYQVKANVTLYVDGQFREFSGFHEVGNVSAGSTEGIDVVLDELDALAVLRS